MRPLLKTNKNVFKNDSRLWKTFCAAATPKNAAAKTSSGH
jgi:hypothetical protein